MRVLGPCERKQTEGKKYLEHCYDRYMTKRRNTTIRLLETRAKRAVSLSKRRQGLFKKAAELCMDFNTQVGIIVVTPSSPSSWKKVHVFGHSSPEAVFRAYMDGSAPEAPNADSLEAAFAIYDEVKALETQVAAAKKGKRKPGVPQRIRDFCDEILKSDSVKELEKALSILQSHIEENDKKQHNSAGDVIMSVAGETAHQKEFDSNGLMRGGDTYSRNVEEPFHEVACTFNNSNVMQQLDCNSGEQVVVSALGSADSGDALSNGSLVADTCPTMGAVAPLDCHNQDFDLLANGSLGAYTCPTLMGDCHNQDFDSLGAYTCPTMGVVAPFECHNYNNQDFDLLAGDTYNNDFAYSPQLDFEELASYLSA